MLGEDHSLKNEFPEFKNLIDELTKNDQSFAREANRYHELDTKIRGLELDNAPIDDIEMHHMKVERASLKDTLYQQLLAHKK